MMEEEGEAEQEVDSDGGINYNAEPELEEKEEQIVENAPASH